MVCNTHHTLRIQIGYGDEQNHTFQCHNCKEPITLNIKNGESKLIGAAEAAPSDEQEQTTNYQYLSSDFVANSEGSRNPFYFGSLEMMHGLLNTPKIKRALRKNTQPLDPHTFSWFALSNALPDWEKLKTSWRLEKNKKYQLARTQLKLLTSTDSSSSWSEAVSLGVRLFDIKEHLLADFNKIKKENPSEISKLATAYVYLWRQDFIDTEFMVFDEFFKRWDQLSQVYIYIHHDLPILEQNNTTSIDFEKVKGFYSLAQEFFSKQVRILTALNNIRSGRNFDKLGKITLDKYLNIDNAKRRENFKDNKIFISTAQEYDSGLRNAEAHNWLKVNNETSDLYYRQGGNGDLVNLRYVDYLYKSVIIFQQICYLMQIESLLKNTAQEDVYKIFPPKN